MDGPYVAGRGRARYQQNELTVEQYYRREIFYAAIDSQLYEINRRFAESSMELLVLSSSMDPREAHEALNIDNICNLVDKFYPEDFSDYDKLNLRLELQHYEHRVLKHPEYKDLSSISHVCHWLVKTRQSMTYLLTYRLLVLTLPVPTTTTKG
ncbi:uncharacterized protein LOC113295535 [Papaver somniferum]|uniref:uncharacterized protein LOC113295535 n=1 Tax=Papaver somniferum TaxID=3469 RepID=UPI000E700D65|nr:uncharacterized protein LOC113295535 [Papaver somniferum]